MGKKTKKNVVIAENKNNLNNIKVSGSNGKKRKKTVIVVLCIVLAVIAALSGTGIWLNNYLNASGYYLKNQMCIKSDNFSLNNAHLSYYFSITYSNFKSEKSSNLESMGLNVNASLKSQKCTYFEGYETWYDYFLNQTQKKMENIICYAEAAKKQEMTLSDEQKSQIDKTIASMTSVAETNKQTLQQYIVENYGTGVTEDVVRECLEYSAIANEYYNNYDQNIKYTDSQLEEFYAKSPEKYNVVSYKSYSIEYALSDTNVKNDKLTALLNNAKAEAEKIAGAKNEQEFDKLLKLYLAEFNEYRGTKKTDKELNNLISNSVTEKYSYSEGTDLSKWAFDKSRKQNDTTVIKDEGNEAYVVYILTKPQYRQTYLTKNVRHILFTSDAYGSVSDALTAAQDVLNAVNREPVKDRESKFIEYAKQYSSDTSSASDGGLYENIKKGEMDTNFDEWCFYSGRKPGDNAVISSNYGYHAMYFVSNGLPQWKSEVTNAKKTEDFANLIAELTKTYNVKFDLSVANQLSK